MEEKVGRLNYLLFTTRGLILLNVAIISLVVAVFGTLSGPMQEWGIADMTRTMLGMEMAPEDREGRIIMLYHTIAIAFLSLLVYIITDIVKMAADQAKRINNTITIGYIMVVVCGLGFGYWGRNWAMHGLFLVGQAMVFYAGILLSRALWPWRPLALQYSVLLPVPTGAMAMRHFSAKTGSAMSIIHPCSFPLLVTSTSCLPWSG
jgi:hypothetical protein